MFTLQPFTFTSFSFTYHFTGLQRTLAILYSLLKLPIYYSNYPFTYPLNYNRTLSTTYPIKDKSHQEVLYLEFIPYHFFPFSILQVSSLSIPTYPITNVTQIEGRPYPVQAYRTLALFTYILLYEIA